MPSKYHEKHRSASDMSASSLYVILGKLCIKSEIDFPTTSEFLEDKIFLIYRQPITKPIIDKNADIDLQPAAFQKQRKTASLGCIHKQTSRTATYLLPE